MGKRNLVTSWIWSHTDCFNEDDINELIRCSENIEDSHGCASILHSLSLRDPKTIFIISLFLGGFGIDRFMIGDIGWGIGKMVISLILGPILALTGIGLIVPIIVWLVDLFLIMNATKKKNYDKVYNLIIINSTTEYD